MMHIREFLHKIRWDPNEDSEMYTVVYLDFGEEREIPYAAITDISTNFMTVNRAGQEVDIPLHRIRKVKKEGRVVWHR